MSEWTKCWKRPVEVSFREQREGEQHVSTREGLTPLKPDDLIMRGVQGEEYPIGRDIFAATYTTEQPEDRRAEVERLTRERDALRALAERLATALEHEAKYGADESQSTTEPTLAAWREFEARK